MMNKVYRSLVVIGLVFSLGLSVNAQYLQDVIRVGQPEYGATARFKALGNAQTALGGDLSSLTGNPAGLGFYNQSDFGFSMDFLTDINDASYFGRKNSHTLTKMGINQAGVVINIPTYKARGSNLETGWLNFNIGLGYSKTNDFNSTLGYSGINTSSTFTHLLADKRDMGNDVEGLFGWDSYLLDFNESNPSNTYHYPTVLEKDNSQSNFLTDRGYQSTTNLSFGSNYSNKLYLGFSLGLSSFRYTNKQVFSENGYTKSYDDIYRENPQSEFLNSQNDAFQFLEADYSLEYNYTQKTIGTGVNGSFGIIYKPVPHVNIGLTAIAPTWYKVSDDASTFMDTWYYDNAQATEAFYTYNSDEIKDYIEYTLRTPYRINGGASILFGQGLVTADVEYVDHTSTHFSASDKVGLSTKQNLDRRMNDQIENTFTSAINYRMGVEYRFADDLLGRIGYARQGSPYKDSDLNTQVVSGGLGYRINNMYIDLTYQNFNQSYVSKPYEIDENWWNTSSPEASVTNNRHRAFLTLGFKF